MRRETRNFIGSPANEMKQELESALKTRDTFLVQLLAAQSETDRLERELSQTRVDLPQQAEESLQEHSSRHEASLNDEQLKHGRTKGELREAREQLAAATEKRDHYAELLQGLREKLRVTEEEMVRIKQQNITYRKKAREGDGAASPASPATASPVPGSPSPDGATSPSSQDDRKAVAALDNVTSQLEYVQAQLEVSVVLFCCWVVMFFWTRT